MEIVIGIALVAWVLYGVASAIGKAGDAVTKWSNKPKPVKPRPYVPSPPAPVITRAHRMQWARERYDDRVRAINSMPIPTPQQNVLLANAQRMLVEEMREAMR